MAYAAPSDVAALVPDLLAGSPAFSAATSPTLAQVEAWLSAGCTMLEGLIASWGYQLPLSPAAAEQVRMANALYAAMWAELSHVTPILALGERTRAQVIRDFLQQEVSRLSQLDWRPLGLQPVARLQFTGGSTPRFPRR